MGDRYTSFARSAAGRPLVKRLGLPDPPQLTRWREGDPIVPGPVLISEGPHAAALRELYPPDAGADRFHALIFDGTALSAPEDLHSLYEFFHPLARSLTPGGRVIVLGTTEASAAQQALDGFVRSVGKEFGRGTTAQLVRLAQGISADAAQSTLDFLLSTKSAYISGQTITVGPPNPTYAELNGRVVLVTGAARGIGAEIARVLAREGAHVICLDVPAAGHGLAGVANQVRGEALQLDLTGGADRLADQIAARRDRLDIVVHNAGITRDKTLAKMDPAQWDAVLGVNLIAPVRVTTVLLERGLLKPDSRVIGVASIAGIAGNRGQTNYAASKAGIIGWIRSLAAQGIVANAVAPGFIETAMTAKMPLFVREAGRRMNSMSQGGLPVDVAETVAWLAAPGSSGVTGNVVRVCGQMLLGA